MVRISVVLAIALLLAACGGDDDASSESTPDTTDSSEESTPDTTEASPNTEPADTTVATTEPTPDTTAVEAPTTTEAAPFDEATIQEMLLDAQPGDVIEIPAGTYSFDRSLTLTVDGVTIRGAGIDDTILSFADQVTGAEGLSVSASDFTIEHLAIEDTVGDALKINEGENITIRSVRVEWTNGPDTDNGAYGIYPVQTANVLIEDSVSIGASDAGIYVGQSRNVIVRNNRAEYNVAGIEIENTIGADVYGNVATNNTGGILIFNLPGLSQRGEGTRIYDNEVVANNYENFAAEGTVVSVVPAGSGILVLANDLIEIFGNTIADNQTANIIVAAGSTVDITGEDDPLFDQFPEGIYIHDNELSGGGNQPDGLVAAIYPVVMPEGGDIPDVLWDGVVDPDKLVDGELPAALRLCVQEVDAEVLNGDVGNGLANPTIGIDEYDCALTPLEPVELAGA